MESSKTSFNIIRKKKNDILPFFWKTLLLFMFIYKNTPLNKMTFVTSERVATILLFLTALFENSWRVLPVGRKMCNKIWKSEIVFQFFLLAYSLILILFIGTGKGSTLTEEIINFLVVSTIALYSMQVVIHSVEELMKILLIITVLQSIIVIAGLVSPSVGTVIDGLSINQTHVYWTYTYYRSMGYPGGLACVAAKGSLQMSLGCVASYYFICNKKHVLKYWFLFGLIAVAMTAVARTGLILSLLVFFLIVIEKLGHQKSRYCLLVLTGVVLGVAFVVILMGGKQFLAERLGASFARVNDLFARGIYNSFLRYYVYSPSTTIPPVTWKTIVGTNILSGTSGNGVTVNVDGGFLRMYAALGIPLTMVFYVFQVLIMIKAKNLVKGKVLKRICLIFIFIMFLGEFKEFYFYLRYLIVIFFAFVYLSETEESISGAIV